MNRWIQRRFRAKELQAAANPWGLSLGDESIVRKEGWHEIVLKPYGGVRKGDKARIWAGGLIDRGGGDQPGSVVAGSWLAFDVMNASS